MRVNIRRRKGELLDKRVKENIEEKGRSKYEEEKEDKKGLRK